MRTLTDREKRTVRFGAAAMGIYLALFCGWKAWSFLEAKRLGYQKLVKQARELKHKVEPYGARVQTITNLMDRFRLDPATLPKKTLLAEASAAIQKAAAGSGIQVGPVREPPRRAASRELTLQFEGVGPVAAVIGLLNRMESVGFPLIIDEVQLTPETARPGQMKFNLTILILDFEQWKEARPNA
jgi:hypothetical protein